MRTLVCASLLLICFAPSELHSQDGDNSQDKKATKTAGGSRPQEDARRGAQPSETDQADRRQRLLTQLNEILETRDNARGLIVNIPDVLFDTGKPSLKPTARERLAKLAEILLSYPDTKIEIDGYTDSIGDRMSNQRLSQERAAGVQSYLGQQGFPEGSIAIHAFGEANPVASNDSLEGRQRNRRVELVVSSQSIGTAQLQK